MWWTMCNEQWAMCCNWACVAICKANSNSKLNLVLNDHSKLHILPVFVKPDISISVSNFCVSSTFSKSNDAMVLKNPSFTSYSFESDSVTNSASPGSFRKPKSFISVSPTNRISFSYSIPSPIKSNDSKSTCALSQRFILSFTSSYKIQQAFFSFFYSSLPISFSQNQKVFNSASVFQTFELSFQSNGTTLPFTTIPSRSWTICMYLLICLVSIY